LRLGLAHLAERKSEIEKGEREREREREREWERERGRERVKQLEWGEGESLRIGG
jgi:hypothetical protein